MSSTDGRSSGMMHSNRDSNSTPHTPPPLPPIWSSVALALRSAGSRYLNPSVEKGSNTSSLSFAMPNGGLLVIMMNRITPSYHTSAGPAS